MKGVGERRERRGERREKGKGLERGKEGKWERREKEEALPCS